MTGQDLLRKFGQTVEAAGSLMSKSPGTSMLDAPDVIIIVKGAQKGLNVLAVMGGWKLAIDGKLGPATSYAIEKVSGSQWRVKKWVEIYNDILEAQSKGRKLDPPPGVYVDRLPSAPRAAGIPSWMLIGGLGVAAWYLFGRKKR